jgi:succinate dehydrogenase cytochrome b556 subunit
MAGMTLQRPMSQRSGGAELFAWYYLRVSGAALVVLALTHIFVTHYLAVPSETTSSFVLDRWRNPLWRTFDWLLLMAAVTHGLLGLRLSIDDFIHRPGVRVFAYSVLWILGFVFIGLGTITIFTLDIDVTPTGQAVLRDAGVLNDQKWIATLIEGSLVLTAILTYVGAIAFAAWVGTTVARGGAPVYWGDPGQYAWVLHRATGIGVTFFLLVHIIDIALIGLGRDLYDQTVAFYAHPFLIPMEIALVGAVIYHALNGIRIMLIDFWKPGGVRLERPLWYAMVALTVLLTIPSGIIILAHAFGG